MAWTEKPSYNVFFLLYRCVEVLDFSGPFDVFSMSNLAQQNGSGDHHCDRQGAFMKLYTVSKTGETATLLHGLKVVPDYGFDNCPTDQIDILIVPGGPSGAVKAAANDPKIISWLQARRGQAQMIASVCVGALILGKAGFFDGLLATTHHGVVSDLERMAPLATVVPGVRYIDNPEQNILSAGGVSSGIDMAFYILASRISPQIAAKTADIMEYNGTLNFAATQGPRCR